MSVLRASSQNLLHYSEQRRSTAHRDRKTKRIPAAGFLPKRDTPPPILFRGRDSSPPPARRSRATSRTPPAIARRAGPNSRSVSSSPHSISQNHFANPRRGPPTCDRSFPHQVRQSPTRQSPPLLYPYP